MTLQVSTFFALMTEFGAQKSPWLVHAADLAKHIDAQREAARRDWENINNRESA